MKDIITLSSFINPGAAVVGIKIPTMDGNYFVSWCDIDGFISDIIITPEPDEPIIVEGDA